MKVLLCLEKSSDLLEAYSYLSSAKIQHLDVTFLQIEHKNDEASVRAFLEGAGLSYETLSLAPKKSVSEIFEYLTKQSSTLNTGDTLVAPFIRYRDIWNLVQLQNKGIKTVHISESLPDSFGHLGYRVAFRGKSLKNWLTAPLAVGYSLTHKPDVCYFPLMPQMANPFVHTSLPVKVPPLIKEKSSVLNRILGGDQRALIVGGFGYDPLKMSNVLGEPFYVATSKLKEIIVDGERIPLPFHISAEEVMLAMKPTYLSSYTSTVAVWAKRIHPDLRIDCYESTEMNNIYGSLFTTFAKRSLSCLGITVQSEQKEMLQVK